MNKKYVLKKIQLRHVSLHFAGKVRIGSFKVIFGNEFDLKYKRTNW